MATTKKKSVIGGLKLNPNLLIASHLKEELNKLFYVQPNYDAELEMLKYQYDREEVERMGLHASSITKSGNLCYRIELINILYFDFHRKGKKVPKMINDLFKLQQARDQNIPNYLARIYEEGKSIGTKWQRLFIRGGLGVKENMDVLRFNEEYDLIYTPDAGITIGKHDYVVEIKSQNTNAFNKDKSHPSGIKQLKFYMYLEKKERGFVLVEDKNTQDFKVLMVTDVQGSDPDISDYIEKMELLQKMKRYALKKKKLPPCPCKKCSPK